MMQMKPTSFNAFVFRNKFQHCPGSLPLLLNEFETIEETETFKTLKFIFAISIWNV